MGCTSCGQKGLAARSARSVQRTYNGTLPAGFDASSAVLIGEPDDVTRRVRVLQSVEGFSIASSMWVTGTGVQAHLDSGELLDITATTQRRRLWRVGGFTYTSLQEARRVAAATGQTVIEVA